jgi:hypothetical protein
MSFVNLTGRDESTKILFRSRQDKQLWGISFELGSERKFSGSDGFENPSTLMEGIVSCTSCVFGRVLPTTSETGELDESIPIWPGSPGL